MPNPITRLDIASLIETLECAERSFHHVASQCDGMGEGARWSMREGQKELGNAPKQLRYAQMENAA